MTNLFKIIRFSNDVLFCTAHQPDFAWPISYLYHKLLKRKEKLQYHGTNKLIMTNDQFKFEALQPTKISSILLNLVTCKLYHIKLLVILSRSK